MGAVSFAAVPGLSSADTPSDGLVSYTEGAYPVISLSDLGAAGQENAVLAAELAENDPNGVLGSFVNDSKKVTIVLTRGASVGPRTLSLLKSPNVEVRYSEYGANEVRGFGDELREQSATLKRLVVKWGPQPQLGGLFISLTGAPSDADRQTIADFAQERSLPIRVEVTPGETAGGPTDSRPTDPSPYAGGARYFLTDNSDAGAVINGRCSYGFPYALGVLSREVVYGVGART